MTKKTLTRRAMVQKDQSDPAPDPFADIDYSKLNLEEASNAEATALMTGFQDRAKNEADRFMLAVDSEFWISIGFRDRAQKEKFLAEMQWVEFGDKYLDGTRIAEKMGIDLPKSPLVDGEKLKSKVDKKLLPLTRRILK